MNATNKLFRRSNVRAPAELLQRLSNPRERSQIKVIRGMATTTIHTPRDPNTLSNYNNFLTTHTTANFDIDFKQKRLVGNVVLDLKSITNAETEEVILDTSYLEINDVKVEGTTPKWSLLSRFEPYGSALSIKLGKGVENGKNVRVNIQVKTTEKCTALQWLTRAQTSNKKHPYMSEVSQCQAIHARSLFPCQDTPDVKSTFEFNIRSPLPVIASGLSTGTKDFQPGKSGEHGTLLYTFKQDIPIPSYLFALASGDIATASIGPRSTVATGPEEIGASKWELEADTEKFIQTAEVNTCGDYGSPFSADFRGRA
ncbi:MAG: hypothetical protein M1830_008494 [Pleopsidium flavum]|nr:MAG: hypothetical protein M1830_008494 [Pleopsidium flavum]